MLNHGISMDIRGSWMNLQRLSKEIIHVDTESWRIEKIIIIGLAWFGHGLPQNLHLKNLRRKLEILDQQCFLCRKETSFCN